MSITTILTRTFNNIYIVMYLYGVGLIASNLVEFFTPFQPNVLSYVQGFK